MSILNNKVCAIILARMGSSRLPGKVLYKLNEKPVIYQLVNRLKKSKTIDKIVVAVPNLPIDQKLIDYCVKDLGVKCFRGSPEDVLDRVYKCACTMGADYIVDITGDCPLIDYNQVDFLVKRIKKYKWDYVSNIFPRSWPDGFDIQVYTLNVLRKIKGIVTNPIHRSHSGWNIIHYRHLLNGLKDMHYIAPKEYNYPDLGMTLDTKEDYLMLDEIFKHFGGNYFTADDAIKFVLDNPDIRRINENVKRKTPGDG